MKKAAASRSPDSSFIIEGVHLLETTADMGMSVEAANVNELFARAAQGMFALISDPGCIQGQMKMTVTIVHEALDYLLVKWLNYLLYLFDAEKKLFCRFDCSVKDAILQATIYGEIYDVAKHTLHQEIKAVTYHRLSVVQSESEWRAEVIFDV